MKTENKDLLKPPLTSAKIQQMHLEMAKILRDKAKKLGMDDIANANLETIVEVHKQVLQRLGFKSKKLSN
jgi:hypothetical protein